MKRKIIFSFVLICDWLHITTSNVTLYVFFVTYFPSLLLQHILTLYVWPFNIPLIYPSHILQLVCAYYLFCQFIFQVTYHSLICMAFSTSLIFQVTFCNITCVWQWSLASHLFLMLHITTYDVYGCNFCKVIDSQIT